MLWYIEKKMIIGWLLERGNLLSLGVEFSKLDLKSPVSFLELEISDNNLERIQMETNIFMEDDDI